MKFVELGLNRNFFKSERVSNEADSSEMSADNNSSTPVNSMLGTRSGEKTANQIITGTVITDCIIKTSSLPARVQISGNDIFMYEDTTGGSSPIVGDTATLNWIRADDNTKKFIMVKRASVNDDLDNVWSFYATPPASGKYNWMFFGRDGDLNFPFRNVGSMSFAVDIKTGQSATKGNGYYGVEVSRNSANPLVCIATGDSRTIMGPGISGLSSVIQAHDGGYAGISYAGNMAMYMNSSTDVKLGLDLIPDANLAYNIGSPAAQIQTIYCAQLGDGSNKVDMYGTVTACPLPTVPNALEVIEKIPAPTKVGERGHFGDKLYFDDETFPEEVLWEIKGKKEIELTNMVGLLMKAVIELNQKVKELESRLP